MRRILMTACLVTATLYTSSPVEADPYRITCSAEILERSTSLMDAKPAEGGGETHLELRNKGRRLLEGLMRRCERAAESAPNSRESAEMSALLFRARLAEIDHTPGRDRETRRRDTIHRAVTAITARDGDRSPALLPFLVTGALSDWAEDPDLGRSRLGAAREIATTHFGKISPEHADVLGTLAFLEAPTLGGPEPPKNPERAEQLYREAFEIYLQLPDFRRLDGYLSLYSQWSDLMSSTGRALEPEYPEPILP